MSEQSKRMEEMLSQLITMVANTNEVVKVMKMDIDSMKSDIDSMKMDINIMKEDITDMKADIVSMKMDAENFKARVEENHTEVLGRFKGIELDQDHIWEKTVRNEREIAKIVRQRN